MMIRDFWMRVSKQLADEGIVESGIEAEIILRHTLDMERADFFAALDDRITPLQERKTGRLLERRVAGEPLAYMLGHREFYGLDFYVNPHVMIPRQETEILVDKVLNLSKEEPSQRLQIADVGTGSGAIAVAIAHNLPSATLYATDSSREALSAAKVNVRCHRLSERIHLCYGDLLEALSDPVDIIVSNPPYLKTSEIAGLQPEVTREPVCALDGGTDGLDVMKHLFRQAPYYMRPGGRLLVEIASQQLESVLWMGRCAFPTARISFDRDMLNLPRVVSIAMPNPL